MFDEFPRPGQSLRGPGDNVKRGESKMAYELTKRCEQLREEAVNVKAMADRVGAQWAYWTRYGRSQLDPAKKHDNITICAAGITSMLKNAPAVIGEDELIVGYNFGKDEYFDAGLDQERVKEALRKSGFSEAQAEWYLDRSVPVAKYSHIPIEGTFTEKEQQLQAEGAITNSDYRRSITANHSVIGYEQVVKEGFEGLLEKVNRYAAINGESSFYDALRSLCEAGCEYGEKYAAEAEKWAERISRKCAGRFPAGERAALEKRYRPYGFPISSTPGRIPSTPIPWADWIRSYILIIRRISKRAV